MSLLTGWMDDARRSYCAYGADLIRTGCLLLRTTPSVAYRAAVLFQRFQAVAEEVRRKRGDYQQENGNREIRDEGETAISVNSLDVELKKSYYIVPAHVGTERASGVLVLGDVYAPLDYCLFNLRKHDDILYLAAACVLVAAKIEDPSTHISHIVRIFMRLNQRRRGEPVIELLQPSQERCNDFKECVLEAEGILLPALGFQTFVECPFKYAIIFLGMMINDDDNTNITNANNNNEGNSNGDAAVNKDFGTASGKLSSLNGVFANIALKKWLADAVCWLNDIPRSVDLYIEEAYVLALCALFSTRPPNITGLPEEWIMAFGVDKTKLNAVLRVHRNYLEEALRSENDNIDLLIAARRTEPCYPIASTNTTTITATETGTGTGTETTSITAAAPTTTTTTSTGIEVSGNYDTIGNIPTTENNNPNVPISLQQSTIVDSNPTLPSSIPTLSASNAPLGVPPMMASLGRLEALQSTLNLNLLIGGNLTLPTNTNGNSNNDNNTHTSHPTNNSNINTSVGMGLAILGDGQNKGVLAASSTAPVIAERPIEEEFHFEDLKEVQRRRRQEEEERRAKRRRSSSKHRRRHYSDDRRRRRSSSRRRDDSRGGRKRPHSQSTHKSHRTEQQQQQQQQHSRDGRQRNDERQRNDDRQRNDERQRNDDRQRNDERHRHDGRRRHDERPRQDARQNKGGKQRRQR